MKKTSPLFLRLIFCAGILASCGLAFQAGANEANQSRMLRVIPTIPRADENGWITLFDGEHLYGCAPTDRLFQSGKVSLQNGALRMDNVRLLPFEWKARNASLRVQMHNINEQRVTLHIGPYSSTFIVGGPFFIDRNDPHLRLKGGRAPLNLPDIFDVVFTVMGKELIFMANGVSIATVEADPIKESERSLGVGAGGQAGGTFKGIAVKSLDEGSQPSEGSNSVVDTPATANSNAAATQPLTPAPSLPTPGNTQTEASPSPTKILSQQALNASDWALAPLEQSVPANIRQNLTALREDLLDEGKTAPKANADAYKFGALLCNNLIAALDERGQASVDAGYRSAQAEANTRVTSQSLEARHNYMMSWPQYAHEKDERSEIQRQQANNTVLVKEIP